MKEKDKLVYIVLTIVILIMVFINIKVFINHYKVEEDNNKVNGAIYNVTTNEQDEENRKRQIASLDTKKRMQTYFGRYISYVESKNYEEAYNLLYDGFKKTYFPSLQDFESFAEQKYPSNMIVNYTDITSEGSIYILKVEIKDALANKDTQAESLQVVINEQDVNEYKISFEVK